MTAWKASPENGYIMTTNYLHNNIGVIPLTGILVLDGHVLVVELQDVCPVLRAVHEVVLGDERGKPSTEVSLKTAKKFW